MEPGEERGEQLGHVPHQVIVHLALVDHEDAPSLGRQGSLYVLEAEAGQAVPVLDHDGRGRRVRKHEASFRRLPFVPEPTSVTTSATESPWAAAHSVIMATWRTRSLRWCWGDTGGR